MTEDVKDEMAVEGEQTAQSEETAQSGETAQSEQSTEAEQEKVAAHIDTVLIRRVLEAAILAADGPLDRDTLLSLFDEAERPDKDNLNLILAELAESYTGRGIELKEVASGFRFQVRSEMGPWVSRLWQEKAPRYSRAILETLALIAYRQPITRGEIEEIRGVAVNTQIIKTLLERNWVRIVGHRDVPGRPAMFASTRQFLDYFGLKSLEELPTLSEIRDLDKINEELQLEEAALAMPRDEHGEVIGDEGRQVTIMEAISNNEPEIDESTLMSLEQVDSVLAGFEAEFRRKPGQAEEEEVVAEPVADEQESDSELFPDVDQNDEDLSQDDDVTGVETKHE